MFLGLDLVRAVLVGWLSADECDIHHTRGLLGHQGHYRLSSVAWILRGVIVTVLIVGRKSLWRDRILAKMTTIIIAVA